MKKITDSLKENFDDLTKNVKNFSVKQSLQIAKHLMINADSKHIGQIISVLKTIAPANRKNNFAAIEKDFKNKGPWSISIKKLMTQTNKKCLNKFFDNFIANQVILSEDARAAYAKKHGFSAPWFMAISPSMRCNLRCTGCYAGEYSKKDDLPFKDYDRLITQAKSMGIHFFTILGGEPFFHEDNYKIFEKHNDCYFLVYTNGTVITEKVADKIIALGNVTPAVSIEGFEKETEARRGKGVWEKIEATMKMLKEKGIIFGFSATFTKKTADAIASEKFVDLMIKRGCSYGWIFQYIPIGKNPDTTLMATPEQREKLRIFTKKMHKEKPIFIADFWNDAPHVGGCMSGGSLYLHVNVHGDVEPCVFVQFSTDNIKEKSLSDCLNSKFFKMIRDRNQTTRSPHRVSDNMLTPCMIIDNPEVLKECVMSCDAKASYAKGEQITYENDTYKYLLNYSKKWNKIADKAWEKEKKNFCYDCVKRCK